VILKKSSTTDLLRYFVWGVNWFKTDRA